MGRYRSVITGMAQSVRFEAPVHIDDVGPLGFRPGCRGEEVAVGLPAVEFAAGGCIPEPDHVVVTQ